MIAPAVRGRTAVLAVSAGIAAYKAVEVCRRLVDLGIHTVVVMTPDAQRFVGAVTFSALASEPVVADLWDPGDPLAHTRLASRADVVVVAPATADLLARYAHGMANEVVSATLLATTAPVIVCPAMHTGMWEHPATQANLLILRNRGVVVVEPGEGRLAGGDMGVGRLAAPCAIVEAVCRVLGSACRDLEGRHVLVTAGGTREPIDPVRYIGNRSSGRQGHAIAAEALARGARVTLVTTTGLAAERDATTGLAAERDATTDAPGVEDLSRLASGSAELPAIQDSGPGLEVLHVETAEEMAEAVIPRAGDADVIVMAAAVADFRPATAYRTKQAKAMGPPDVSLVPTRDILAEVGSIRRPGQVVVGFAAETGEVLERARAKLVAKGADLIVANDVSLPGVGFSHATNAVTILGANGSAIEVPLTSKTKVAGAVVDAIVSLISSR